MRCRRPRSSHAFLLILLLCGARAVARASEVHAADESGEGTRPAVRVGELTPGLVLDGRLDDPAWSQAPDSIANLTTIEPREGAVPAARTVVKVLADADHLVFGIHCYDPDPSGIVSSSKARDPLLDEEDHVILVLDTFQDGRSGYVFAVNPAGARFDGLVAARGEESNAAWDAIWEAKTSRDASGWSAEIRIPAKSLSFDRSLTAWGFNVQRRVQRLQEVSRWAGVSRDHEVYQTSQSGSLTDVPTLDQGRGLSVRPALVLRATKPGKDLETKYESEISLDATKTLGPSVLSSLTINTDFAETEVDTRQINLTRFPVFFPEKRTFFLSGADIFEFGLGLDEETLLPFFSRRIGLFGVTEEEQAEIPINAGVKVNGRVGENNLGALAVQTRKVDGLHLEEEDLFLDIPQTTMGAFRVKRNVLDESSVGLLANVGDQAGRKDSWTAGLDFTYQTSSYRDDQNFLVGAWGLLNDREGLTGEKSAYGVRVDYPNDPVDINLSSYRIGDAFDPSLGFVPRRGVHLWDLSTTITPRPWWRGVRELTHELNFTLYNAPSNNTWISYSVSARPFDVLFQSGDRLEFAIEPEGDRPDDTFSISDDVDLPSGSYEWTRYLVGVRSAEKRRVNGHLLYEWGEYYDGDLRTVDARLAVRPNDLLTVELTGERNTGTFLAVTEVDTVEVFEKKDLLEEVFGARIEVNISPDLQISSFTQYDTQSREIGSNNRLRWTFSPQGDLFVVYNHNMARDVDRKWKFVSNQAPVKIQYTWRF